MISGLSKATAYQAIQGKDKKYDGIFYFGVKTTGIYCRPSCLAYHALLKRYPFFDTIDEAQSHGYHACKSCHPDRLKNGLSVEILDNISTGAINDKGVNGLAHSLHISERHLRRLVHDRTGTSPLRLNRTRRLNAAKLLVLQTKLPIIDIAFNSEFSSLRQFNSVFRDKFKTSPTKMRKAAST